MQTLKQYVIKQFGSKVAQDYYIKKADYGLWYPEANLIKKYFKGKKVLDVGCGTGRTTIPLFKQGFDVTGIDITPNMIKNAKKIAKEKNLKIKYEIADATKMKFKDNSFDNVLFSNNGWAQIPGEEERIKALNEIHRVLKPNGCYIFATNIRTSFEYLLFLLSYKSNNKFKIDFGDRFFRKEGGGLRYDEKQFVHIPTLKEVKKQLSDAGFKLEYYKIFPLLRKLNILLPMFYVCRKLD